MPATIETNKIQMKFSTYQLESILVALINNPFNRKLVANINQLFKLFQPQSYTDDFGKETRVYMIRTVCRIILDGKIDDKEALLGNLSFEGKYEPDAVDIMNRIANQNISDNELSILDRAISDQLKYKSITEDSEKLVDLLNGFMNENYDSMEGAIIDIECAIDLMSKNLKSAKSSLGDAKKDMNLSSNSFINILGNIIDNERNPAARVQTGIQYLNEMLMGGFQKSRLAIACGMAKGGKSAFLLQCAIWAKLYNTFVTKDPSKKPVIVYLSMENTNEETVERIWNYCFGDDDELKNHDKAEAASMLEKAGIFTPNDPTAPELLLWYRSNRSINASDIAGMLDDLEKEGKECVFLIVDYLARMRAIEFNKEQRLELSNITNDLKVLAADFDIPVLTAHQLNREAFRTFESAPSFEEKIKASNSLGVSQIGDSIDIVRNCDIAFIVNRIQNRCADENGEFTIIDKYLFVKLIATRMKMPKITSFQHRFKEGNGMALIDDIRAGRPYSTKTDIEYIQEKSERNGQRTMKGGRQIIT